MGELNNGNISNLFWSTDGKTWHKVEGPVHINLSALTENLSDLSEIMDRDHEFDKLEIVPNEGGRQ